MVSLTRVWNGVFAWRAATLINYDTVLWRDDLTRSAIGGTLTVAAGGATVCLLLGLVLAWGLIGAAPRRSHTAGFTLSVTSALPAVVIGLGLLILFRPTPLFGTVCLVAIACVARFLPLLTGKMLEFWRGLDPALELAARASGATWRQTMRFIVLPLSRPWLPGAWILLFALFARELGAAILLYAPGGETISVALVLLTERDPGRLAALALLQMAILLAAFAAYHVSRAPDPLRPA